MDSKEMRVLRQACLELACSYKTVAGVALDETEILMLAQKYYDFIIK